MKELTMEEAKEILFAELGEREEIYEEDISPRYFVEKQERIRPETICGVDSRIKVTATTVMPYMAICKLLMKSPTGRNYMGTGWLTHENKLYTAGHCVFDRDADDWMKSITVIPGKSGYIEPYGRYEAIKLAATRGWIEQGSYRFDMGAIKLGTSVNHSEFLLPKLADPSRGEVCGYPGDRDTGLFQYKMDDVLSKQGGQFKYMLDTFGGQSGSPLLENRIYSVGIHNYGGCPNSASDLYPEFISYVDSW